MVPVGRKNGYTREMEERSTCSLSVAAVEAGRFGQSLIIRPAENKVEGRET